MSILYTADQVLSVGLQLAGGFDVKHRMRNQRLSNINNFCSFLRGRAFGLCGDLGSSSNDHNRCCSSECSAWSIYNSGKLPEFHLLDQVLPNQDTAVWIFGEKCEARATHMRRVKRTRGGGPCELWRGISPLQRSWCSNLWATESFHVFCYSCLQQYMG